LSEPVVEEVNLRKYRAKQALFVEPLNLNRIVEVMQEENVQCLSLLHLAVFPAQRITREADLYPAYGR
jgi:hypothetical protein